MEWFTIPAPEYEALSIDRISVVFTGTNKYDGKPEPGIKSWAHPVDALKNLLNIYAT